MSTAARSWLRVTSNVAVTLLNPLLVLEDVRYERPSTPLIACSMGIVTADSTVCALAPVYTLETFTCGGASVGYCAIGSVGIAIRPPRMMTSEQTVESTGRRMNVSTNMTG